MVVVWNVITVIKIHRHGRERVRLWGILTLFQTCQSSARSSGGGGGGGGGQGSVMTWGIREVKHQWEAAYLYVCVWICELAYSRGTTSGTSEQCGCCCEGHRGGRSTPPTFPTSAYPQPLFSPLSTVHLIAPPNVSPPRSHTAPWLSLVSRGQMGIHMEPFSETGKAPWKALLCRRGPGERNGMYGGEGAGRRMTRSPPYLPLFENLRHESSTPISVNKKMKNWIT